MSRLIPCENWTPRVVEVAEFLDTVRVIVEECQCPKCHQELPARLTREVFQDDPAYLTLSPSLIWPTLSAGRDASFGAQQKARAPERSQTLASGSLASTHSLRQKMRAFRQLLKESEAVAISLGLFVAVSSFIADFIRKHLSGPR